MDMSWAARQQAGQPRLRGSDHELPGCSGDERGDDVSRVPVQAGACPVIAHRGARVGVRRFLDVAQRHPGIETAPG